MFYYKRNIGDYAAATRSLNFTEHGAYNLMLDTYYVDEAPFPLDIKEVAKIMGARSKNEVTAMEYVLNKFFTKTETGWIHKRCDREIADYHKKAETNKTNGKGGGRPKKTQSVISGFPNNTELVSENLDSGNLNHKPRTINQEPLTINQVNTHTEEILEPVTASKAGAVCVALRSEGFSANPSNPELQGLIAGGAEISEFVDAARIAKEKHKGIGYVMGIVKRTREDAKRQAEEALQAPAKPAKTQTDAWWTSNAGVDRMARSLGMTARANEDYASFKDRIFAELKNRDGGAV